MKQSKAKIGLLLLIGVMFCGLLVSCGSEYDSRTTEQVKKVIDIVDQYLDYDISYDSAYKQIKSIQGDIDDSTSESRIASTNISMLSLKMTLYNTEKTTENYNDLIDERNELASSAGLSKR